MYSMISYVIYLYTLRFSVDVISIFHAPFWPNRWNSCCVLLPQGSVMSSLLYILYVSELDTTPVDDSHILQYADNICVYSLLPLGGGGLWSLEQTISNVSLVLAKCNFILALAYWLRRFSSSRFIGSSDLAIWQNSNESFAVGYGVSEFYPFKCNTCKIKGTPLFIRNRYLDHTFLTLIAMQENHPLWLILRDLDQKLAVHPRRNRVVSCPLLQCYRSVTIYKHLLDSAGVFEVFLCIPQFSTWGWCLSRSFPLEVEEHSSGLAAVVRGEAGYFRVLAYGRFQDPGYLLCELHLGLPKRCVPSSEYI